MILVFVSLVRIVVRKTTSVVGGPARRLIKMQADFVTRVYMVVF